MSRPALTAAIRRQLADLPVDETRGELAAPPHVQLFLLRDGATLLDYFDDELLEDADVRYLERCAGGVIVTLLQDGTYSVRYYDDEDEIEDRWGDLCSDLEGGAAGAAIRALDDEVGDERQVIVTDDEDTDPDYDDADGWSDEEE